MKKDTLHEKFENRKSKFISIIEFLKINKQVKQNCDRFFYSSLFAHSSNAKEKLRILYIDSISAAGGNNLTRNGASCQKFYKRIDSLPESKHIDLKIFYHCLDNNIDSFKDLFFYMGKNILNFGNKKSALFINKLNWVQQNFEEGEQIFSNYHITLMDLMIPIDNVITLILNEILCENSDEKLNQYRDFLLINEFFKENLKGEFMLIEDLWFWGFFSTTGNVKNRIVHFNEDKFYTAKFLRPTEKNKKVIIDFIELLKSE